MSDATAGLTIMAAMGVSKTIGNYTLNCEIICII